eukprot:gnl/MRDRNA2_/MRDRNA2_43900_c0_seq1.p1 gnl/MRDRNA2_/MRDRNA2_43900_c0~~gnl/MRDRNA2_/MRDRNA2_43900_c0_seq1.p1  ORF type:complete len:210 (+),score=44.43 gnl/MRDRNA2_/MRDRNA2_43900_c0_seq1:119-748(+)
MLVRVSALFCFIAPAAATVKCVDPPTGQPDYCCDGIMPVMENSDLCECNHDWSGEECTCNGVVLRNACVSCMVHLPASNQFNKAFSDGELKANCKDCVDRCIDSLKDPTGEGAICHSFVDKFMESHFVVATPAETMCENAALKETLYGDKVPLQVKQAIFRRPTLDPWTGEKDTRFDWDVPGIGHEQHSNAAASVEKVLRERKYGKNVR